VKRKLFFLSFFLASLFAVSLALFFRSCNNKVSIYLFYSLQFTNWSGKGRKEERRKLA